MSDTKKEGKRFHCPKVKGETPAIRSAVLDRHSLGSTEKILRRNRKLWTWLVNRCWWALGKAAIDESATE